MGSAWLTQAGKQCRRGTGWFYRASFQVRLPRACKVPGGDASEYQHLSALPSLPLSSGGAGRGSCCREPFVGSGVPPLHTQGPRFRHRVGLWDPQHPEPAAGATPAQPRNRGRTESIVLVQHLHKFCFKGLQFFTLQSSQAGSSAKKMAVQTPLACCMEELGLAQHGLPNCPRVLEVKGER